MSVLSTPLLDIEYFESGSRHGTPVLLLHGFPDCADSWRAVTDSWTGPAARFLAPSHRGYGATRVKGSAPTGEFAALGADALALMDGLGIERAVVAGHDWGARAAYALAALYPERVHAVVGLASEYVAYRHTGVLPHAQERAYWYQWFFNTPQGEESLTRDRAGLCRLLWETWSPTWSFANAEFADAAASWANPQFVEIVLSYYRFRYGNAQGSLRYAGAAEALKRLPKIAAPTWFLTGLADACNLPEGSEGQEAWFTGSYQRIELEDKGHFLQREAPDAVSHAIAQALGAV